MFTQPVPGYKKKNIKSTAMHYRSGTLGVKCGRYSDILKNKPSREGATQEKNGPLSTSAQQAPKPAWQNHMKFLHLGKLWGT